MVFIFEHIIFDGLGGDDMRWRRSWNESLKELNQDRGGQHISCEQSRSFQFLNIAGFVFSVYCFSGVWIKIKNIIQCETFEIFRY